MLWVHRDVIFKRFIKTQSNASRAPTKKRMKFQLTPTTYVLQATQAYAIMRRLMAKLSKPPQ